VSNLVAGLWFSGRKRPTPDAPASADVRKPDAAAAEPPLVLVVDDYADTRLMYVENLRAAGFRVAEAGDGEEAVAMAVDLAPAAIVMDLSMPRLDGWDATRQIRAQAALRNVYIVALSAMKGMTSRAMAFDAGCDDFVEKPLDPMGLVAIVRARLRPDSGNDGHA
jgi:two-component system phosphate regulon response regulator PhoB